MNMHKQESIWSTVIGGWLVPASLAISIANVLQVKPELGSDCAVVEITLAVGRDGGQIMFYDFIWDNSEIFGDMSDSQVGRVLRMLSTSKALSSAVIKERVEKYY